VFFGTFQHTIDAKGRTSLPARFREALAAGGEPRVALIRYPHWKAIQALPHAVWSELKQRVLSTSPLDARAQRNILKFVSTAHEVEVDVHGRVLVPPDLRAWAGLSRDVVWVGMGRTMQLWDRAAHEQSMAEEVPEAEVLDFFKV
jgi:MraZ protein